MADPNEWKQTGLRYMGSEVHYFVIADGVDLSMSDAQALFDEFHSFATEPPKSGHHWQLQACVYIKNMGWTSGKWTKVHVGSPQIKDMSHGSDGTGVEFNVRIQNIQVYRTLVPN
jgi:hypothetical protein